MLELLETVRNSSITLLLGTDSAPNIFLTFPTGGAHKLCLFWQLHFKIQTAEMPEWQMTGKKEKQFQAVIK